jgi:hypothetical protein
MSTPTKILKVQLTADGASALDFALQFEELFMTDTEQVDYNIAEPSVVGTYAHSLNDWLGEGTGKSEVATKIEAKLELLMPDPESVPESARAHIVAVVNEIWTSYELEPTVGPAGVLKVLG